MRPTTMTLLLVMTACDGGQIDDDLTDVEHSDDCEADPCACYGLCESEPEGPVLVVDYPLLCDGPDFEFGYLALRADVEFSAQSRWVLLDAEGKHRLRWPMKTEAADDDGGFRTAVHAYGVQEGDFLRVVIEQLTDLADPSVVLDPDAVGFGIVDQTNFCIPPRGP